MRKLASIQRIWKIEPIEDADRIELAHVLGWQCVVNKGQFRAMDPAVYFEVDSFLPVAPQFEFMRASSYRKSDIMGEGFKLRTLKFRGQISQGLLLPLSDFPEIPEDADIGTDVTDLLGVPDRGCTTLGRRYGLGRRERGRTGPGPRLYEHSLRSVPDGGPKG